ncbi:MAG: pitrilysin family protein [Spirochaetota bacterium]|nr:pitrilysin family protein [Spirochaetota bacterium]
MKKGIFLRIIAAFPIILIWGFYGDIKSVQRAFAEYRDNSPIANIQLPEVISTVLDNGIRIFYVQDELPKLNIVVSAGLGKLYENKGNAGIAELIAKTLSLGGSKKYPGISLHQTIESIGGELSILSSWEETTISLRVLERYSDLAFEITSELIQHPIFDDTFIDQAKSFILEDVRRKKDSPEILAFDKAKEIIFNGNGYGAVETEETLGSITREDIIELWNSHFKASNIIIGVSSSLNFSTIKEYLKNSFSRLEKGKERFYSIDNRSIADSMIEKSKRIYLIHKDIPQATIVIGTNAPSYRYSGVYALEIMNYILGGGSFNSRLMKEIRVKRGLSYAVQSIIRFRRDTGVFLAYAQTKNDTVDLALSLLMENIGLMMDEPVLDEELKWAKEAIMNSYIFEFNTISNVLGKYIFLSYYGFEKKFLREYQNNIYRVTKDDIREDCKGLLADGLIKVVVGNRSLKDKLEEYGKVIILEP